MKIDAATYRVAANERLRSAHELYQQGSFALCFYVAGVAVECILRAHRCLVNTQFDARHDLKELYVQSRLSQKIGERFQDTFAVLIDRVGSLWHNNHRYLSEAALRRFLKKGRHDRGILGDALKENARRLLNDATKIVQRGVELWNV